MFYALPDLIYDVNYLVKQYNRIKNSNKWRQYGKDPLNSIFVHDAIAPEIISKFKPGILSNQVKFAKMLSGGGAQCHTDTRQCGILIPVIVEKGQVTNIHKKITPESQPDHLNLEGDESLKLYESPIIDSFYLDTPFILNTHSPHSVTVNSNADRVILTLSVNDKYDNFELLKSMHKKGELLGYTTHNMNSFL